MTTRVQVAVCSVLLSAGTACAHPDDIYEGGLSAPAPATVLLITSPELAEAWNPFAEWKKRLGRPVRIMTTARIADEYEGKDLQDKIRRCVRDHIDHQGTWWVILGGDSAPDGKGVVPDRDTLHRTMWGENKAMPTDIYYLSKKSWDSDGDGVYGEWEEDRDALSYPDGTVGLGRIPVRTPVDVKAYTDKVIAYESQYPEKDFATNMTYTCTVGAAYPKVRRSWDDHVSKALEGGKLSRFFADETPWDGDTPGDYALSPENWVKLINDKATGKMHFHGHGLLPGWVLENDQMATADHVGQLTNKNAYPVVTTVSCFTGQYDAKKDPSIAECILRQPGAGAILVVAPAREGKPHFHDPKRDFPLMMKEGKLDGTTRTMTLFWENGLAKSLSAGEALMTAKASMARDAKQSATFHLCLCELNLLGDPTLSLRATNPKRPEIAGPKALEAGNLSLVIETDAPGSLVSLMDGKNLYAVDTTDASGIATFPITVEKDTTITVTCSGEGLNASSMSIPVR